jgi:hypothetical protein
VVFVGQQVFDGVLQLEELQADEAINVLRESQQLPSDVLPHVQQMLAHHTIPIKKLLTVVDLARCAISRIVHIILPTSITQPVKVVCLLLTL